MVKKFLLKIIKIKKDQKKCDNRIKIDSVFHRLSVFFPNNNVSEICSFIFFGKFRVK